MKRIALTVLTLAAALLVAPAAQAGYNYDTMSGGCTLATPVASDAVNGGAFVGFITDFSVSTTGLVPTLIAATVTCSVVVNGVTVPGSEHTYGDGTSAVQAGADPIEYTAGPTDTSWLCEVDHFADGTTLTDRCPNYGESQLPPQRVLDLYYAAFDAVNGLISNLDPVVCPVLVKLAGDYPGGVTIGPDGDVDAADPFDLWTGPLYDCPPYGVTG